MNNPLQITLKSLAEEGLLLSGIANRLQHSGASEDWNLGKASVEQGINPALMQQLVWCCMDVQQHPLTQLKAFPIYQLLDFLRLSHRFYLQKQLPEIELALNGLSRAYVRDYPFLQVLKTLFSLYKSDLEAHILEEELHLFPFLEHLESGVWENIRGLRLEQMIADHQDTSEPLKCFKKMVNNHHQSSDLPLPYAILLNKVSNFNQDLSFHHLLEETVLIPLGQELQEKAGSRLPLL